MWGCTELPFQIFQGWVKNCVSWSAWGSLEFKGRLRSLSQMAWSYVWRFFFALSTPWGCMFVDKPDRAGAAEFTVNFRVLAPDAFHTHVCIVFWTWKRRLYIGVIHAIFHFNRLLILLLSALPSGKRFLIENTNAFSILFFKKCKEQIKTQVSHPLSQPKRYPILPEQILLKCISIPSVQRHIFSKKALWTMTSQRAPNI